jgi:hypothetical protein
VSRAPCGKTGRSDDEIYDFRTTIDVFLYRHLFAVAGKSVS